MTSTLSLPSSIVEDKPNEEAIKQLELETTTPDVLSKSLLISISFAMKEYNGGVWISDLNNLIRDYALPPIAIQITRHDVHFVHSGYCSAPDDDDVVQEEDNVEAPTSAPLDMEQHVYIPPDTLGTINVADFTDRFGKNASSKESAEILSWFYILYDYKTWGCSGCNFGADKSTSVGGTCPIRYFDKLKHVLPNKSTAFSYFSHHRSQSHFFIHSLTMACSTESLMDQREDDIKTTVMHRA